MEIEVFSDDSLGWSGDFAVAAETGPYAHQVGSFYGTVTGNSISAICETSDGVEFQLTGTAVNRSSLKLTRSDIPGTVLDFQLIQPNGPVARADTSFNMSSGGSSGRVGISTTPYSIQGGGTMYEYRGTWLGLNCTFWAYTSGYATVVTQVNDFAINSANFRSYKLSDFGTVSQSTTSSQVSIWSPVTKSQVKYTNVINVSP